jgi:hypothetical protein
MAEAPKKGLGEKAADAALEAAKNRFIWDMNMSAPAVLLKGVVWVAKKLFEAPTDSTERMRNRHFK